MHKHWSATLTALALMVAVAGCTGPQGGSQPEPEPPPAGSEPARPDRAPTKEGTISLEGTDNPFTFHLFAGPGFTTYVPQDMIAAAEGDTARMVANFGGQRNDNAYLEVSIYPAGITEAEARTRFREAGAGFEMRERRADVPATFSWSLDEYLLSDGTGIGMAALGQHGDRYFQIIEHYPEEYAEGFVPRARKVLAEWQWDDTGAGLGG